MGREIWNIEQTKEKLIPESSDKSTKARKRKCRCLCQAILGENDADIDAFPILMVLSCSSSEVK